MEIVVSLAEAERDPLGRASSLAARDVKGVSGMDGAAERSSPRGCSRRPRVSASLYVLAFFLLSRAFEPSTEPFPSHF